MNEDGSFVLFYRIFHIILQYILHKRLITVKVVTKIHYVLKVHCVVLNGCDGLFSLQLVNKFLLGSFCKHCGYLRRTQEICVSKTPRRSLAFLLSTAQEADQEVTRLTSSVPHCH